MRVHLYTLETGGFQVMVEPSPGKRKPPVMIPGVTTENLRAKVGQVVKELREPRMVQGALPGA